MAALDGKVAIVTGGTRGIGHATAQALAGAGARVMISATTDAAESAARSLGEAVAGMRADVRRDEDVQRLFDATVSRFGGVDILVNNAGIGVFAPVEQTSLEDWRGVVDTNLTGVFLCTRRAIPLMRSRGGGWIINVSSLASTNPFAEGAAYCATKAGLNAFTDALLQEVRHDGIRVATVLPGSVRTTFMGRGRRAPAPPASADDWKLTPDDVAHVIVDLLGHPPRSLPSRVEIRPSRPPRK